MNKRILDGLLMAALVVGLGMSVTSCKDNDDDNERTPEEIAQDPYEKESEAADALYRLVSQLSVCDSLPNNWKTAIFEPKAGKVIDSSQPRVRTIAVNNAAEAVARYNSLTGKELPATTITDTYKVEGVGTLQLNVGGAGAIATIDVNVQQMPQLQQLRLVSAADMGENGSFWGEPYYSFGDVVMDEDSCYWICVRPAYSPNGKEDTHWMSFQLTEKNLKTYTKKGCEQQVYPVDLGVQKEKMQYLAQLLAILANPDGYQTEAGLMGEYFNGTGLGGLQPAAMPVDSLVKQARLWNENKIWEKIMPVGFKPDEVQTFKDFFKNASVAFIYEKGSTSGTNLTIKVVLYPNAKTFYKEAPFYEKEKVDMREIAFDVTNSYSTKGKRTNDNCTVPDAFVVRYKSGYQLSSNWVFSPSATEPIPGVKTVHRFNDEKTQLIDLGSYTREQARPKMIMAKDGKFYKNEAACKANNTEPMALVFYVGNDADASGKYRGLAISYAKKETIQWDSCNFIYYLCFKNTTEDQTTWNTQKNGIERTKQLYEDDHDHPAAEAAWDFKVEGFNPAKYGYSNWFLPTAGQAIMAVKGIGGYAKYHTVNGNWDCSIAQRLDEQLADVGINTFDLNFKFWTSTEYNMDKAVYFWFGGDAYNFELCTTLKKAELDVRPFIAF